MRLIAEELFLLSIDHKTKRPYGRAASLLSYTLNGALLAELMLKECIIIKNNKIEVVRKSVEDLLLQEALEIVVSKPGQTPKQMIGTFRRILNKLQVKLAERLDQRGDIELEKKELLGLPVTSFYQLKRSDVHVVYRDAFRRVINQSKNSHLSTDDQSKMILLSFVYQSHLLRIIFTEKVEAKQAEQFIKALSDHLPASQSTQQLLEAVNISLISAASQFTL